VEKISKDVMSSWRECPPSKDLAIPDANELIDKDYNSG